MKHDEIMTKLFDISRPTYYKWKKEKRPIVIFIEKYFSDEEILEFLKFDSIEQLDICKKKAPDFFKKIHFKVDGLEKRIAILENERIKIKGIKHDQWSRN